MNEGMKEKLDALKAENEQLKKQVKNSKTDAEYLLALANEINLAQLLATLEIMQIVTKNPLAVQCFFGAINHIYEQQDFLKSCVSENRFKEIQESLNFKELEKLRANRKPVAQA